MKKIKFDTSLFVEMKETPFGKIQRAGDIFQVSAKIAYLCMVPIPLCDNVLLGLFLTAACVFITVWMFKTEPLSQLVSWIFPEYNKMYYILIGIAIAMGLIAKFLEPIYLVFGLILLLIQSYKLGKYTGVVTTRLFEFSEDADFNDFPKYVKAGWRGKN